MATAVTHLQRALSLAEPGGYIRLFLDHQEATLARLLHQVAAGGGVTAAYAHKLLAHVNPDDTDDTPAIQPLSSRELEVLQHLAQGLQNKEIARDLVISERTVKFHVSAVLSKLGATNRTEAAKLARERGLLSS